MTNLQLELPDDVIDAIKRRGMLNSDGIAELLREALRAKAYEYIDEFTKESERRGLSPMSDAEIQEEIKASRRERGI